MVERATVTQKVQIGVETTPGTAVAATKQLLALSIGLNVAEATHTFQPKGAKYATIVYNGKEWVDADVSGDATYSEMQYILASTVAAPTIAQILDVAIPTGGWKWVFDSSTFNTDTPKTFTVEQGDATRASRAANMIMTAFTIAFDRSGVTIAGDGYAAQLQDGVTLTSGGITTIPTVPIQPTQISVFLDTTAAGLGVTKMLRVISGEWALTGRWAGLFVVDSAQPSFVAHVEKDPASHFKLKVEADTLGMALLTTFRAANSMFMRLLCTGPNIYTGALTVNYSFTVDSAGKIDSVSKFEDSDGVYAVEFTFTTVHDSTWGKAFHIELINTQSTL